MNGLVFCLCFALRGPPAPDRWVAEDKWKHFFASFVVTSLAASGARAAGAGPDASLVAGAVVGTGVGVAKEIRDARTPGESASFRDLVWDGAGVGIATVFAAQGR